MNRFFLIFLSGVLLCSWSHLKAQRLMVSKNGRFLQTADGKPFFWLADTAWELLHRCNREEVDAYLAKRAAQGFNVIQTVALAELDGLQTANRYGHTPLINLDPSAPDSRYFEHVDYVIQKAASLGMYIALLPTWGDKLFKDSWGTGPEIFNTLNAAQFGHWIGDRYKDKENIIWIIGGDRTPRPNSQDIMVWNAMARAIAQAAGGFDQTLMSFHPQPKDGGGSSTWFHQEPWLDFNMHQTGHCPNQGTYQHIQHDHALSPIKPTLDGEPLYEDHPNCFNATELGPSVAEDIRRIMYWNVFAGAMGQTYGCHDVWQMYTTNKEGINHPLRPWPAALDLPMARQMKHLKNLMLSRPYFDRIPDQQLVTQMSSDEMQYIAATRDRSGSYAMIYFPEGGSAQLNLLSLRHKNLLSYWYDPRTGSSFAGPSLVSTYSQEVSAPSSGKGHDWVLVIDNKQSNFQAPGKLSLD